MDLQHLIQGEEDRFHFSAPDYSARRLNARPYRWCAAVCAFSNFLRRSEGFAAATISRAPSVVTSRGDSGSILSRSRIGLSMTRAKLFPCFVSFLIIDTPYFQCITLCPASPSAPPATAARDRDTPSDLPSPASSRPTPPRPYSDSGRSAGNCCSTPPRAP